METRLRRKTFRIYADPAAPRFTLSTWATDRTDARGCTRIKYRLTERRGSETGAAGRIVLFEGSDFCGSPMHADDSDATLGALLAFLTLRPGDTDEEYFANYTDAQRAFASEHAETLALEAMRLEGSL